MKAIVSTFFLSVLTIFTVTGQISTESHHFESDNFNIEQQESVIQFENINYYTTGAGVEADVFADKPTKVIFHMVCNTYSMDERIEIAIGDKYIEKRGSNSDYAVEITLPTGKTHIRMVLYGKGDSVILMEGENSQQLGTHLRVFSH